MIANRAAERKRAVVVIGAGRSGTSTITRSLQALGIDLGDRLKPPAAKNPKGFFEDLDILDLNRQATSAFGLSVKGASVRLIEPEEWQAPALVPLRARAVDTLRRRFGGSALWGFKSGGIERLLPFWEGVFRTLDLDVSYVLALRNPLSVARSRAKLDSVRGLQEKSDLEWVTRNVGPFRLAAEHPLVVVDYDLLADDPRGELERVARGLGIPFTAAVAAGVRRFADEFLQPSLRHTRFTLDDLERSRVVNPLARDAYRWLRALAAGESTIDAAPFREAWEKIERDLELLRPVLRLVDHLEEEARRARGGFPAGLQSLFARLTASSGMRAAAR